MVDAKLEETVDFKAGVPWICWGPPFKEGHLSKGLGYVFLVKYQSGSLRCLYCEHCARESGLLW